MSSAHASSEAGIWIEICSDSGPVLAQVNEGDKEPVRECAHCSVCLIQASEFQALNTRIENFEISLNFSTDFPVFELNFVPDAVERYWSATRGHPLETKSINMPTSDNSAVTSLFSLAAIPWSNPWV